MFHRSNHKILFPTFALTLAGCTAITGASDFKVDPKLDVEDAGRDASDGKVEDAAVDAAPANEDSVVRDLQFTFKGMYPHELTPLDIAVVSAGNILQARARIVLPKSPEDRTMFPDISVNLNRGLPPGPHSLFVFADTNGDGLVDFKDNGPGNQKGIIEHVWKIELKPSGIGEFTHVTDFQQFDEGDYSALNGDLVMQMPETPSTPGIDFAKCIEEMLAGEVEIRLTLKSADRQVGLFRRAAATPIPKDGIRLRGILDGGSIYRIDVVVDNAVINNLERAAPATGNLEVAAADWFPVSLDSLRNCR